MDLLHLGRRGSASAAPGVTASGSGSGAGANNDDRHPYPTPSTSASFTSPEGSYELAYEVSPPVPATPATPGLAGAGSNPAAALAALNANPEHIPSLCVVSIRIPAAGSGGSGSGSGLLGLGGSQRGRAREASVSPTGGAAAGGLGAGITGQEYAGGFNASHDDQASSSNSASSYGGEASNSYPSNLPSLSPGPPSKRKALVSLPSMPSLPSVGLPGLGGGGANHSANAASNATHKEQNAPTSKPKSAFRGTSSTFVKGYEGLPLSSRADKLWQSAEPRDVTLAVSTVGKSVLITDISPRAKSRDPIARLSFAAAPTSIAINQTTLSSDRIDIVVGFSTGDLLWMEVFSGRYTRYNKDASTPPSNNKVVGYVSSAAVKRLQWLAGDQVFVAGFADGSLAFYDKDRDDPSGFTPSQGLAPSAAPTGQQPSLLARMDSRLGLGVEGSAQTADPSTPGSYQEERDGMSKAGSRRLASYREAVEETTSDIVVTIPAANSEKKTAGKLNPLAHWKVSRKSITDFAISPDSAHCAVVSEDGCLRIIDCNSQRLLDTFQAYFGALTCVSWSPDGRFVLTGGQDDLACVWSPFEQRIVARCEGHSSFLTGLSFDAWRCDSRTQRFASVSEDCKLILWDLSSAALQRPKGHHHHHHHHGHHAPSQQHGPYGRRASASSALSLVRKRTIESNANLPLAYGVEREAPLWHRAPNRSEVPGLQPVTVKQISSELLAGIVFTSNMVVTLSRASTVKVFMRPEQRF